MMRLWWIVWVVACQPLGDTSGDLAAHGAGQRFYWQMNLGDIGVKKDRAQWIDKRVPTKIHALRSMPHKATGDLSLSATQVKLNTTINLANVIFSWQVQNNTYTCHLHNVSLGEQRDVIEGGSVKDALCFEQKKTDGDYVRLLADHCVSASNERGSRFIFREGKDFACDLSKSRDESPVLQAACLVKGDTTCLGGQIRKCAERTEGFANFITAFKNSVESPCPDDTGRKDKCPIEYKIKGDLEETSDLTCKPTTATEQTEEGGD